MLTLVTLFKKSKHMMRIELLKFLSVEDIVKLALLCKTLNELIDANKKLISTDDQMNETYLFDFNG